MNQLNYKKLFTIILISIACIVIIICTIIGFAGQKNNGNESETLTDPETVALEIEVPSETDSELVTIPESSTAADITFSSNEDTYNYAVSMINERKYYSAIKYLRQIPGYKDADALQTKIFKLINTDYFEFSEESGKIIACEGMNADSLASDKAITRVDSSIPNDKIAQRGTYWYLDTDGVFHTVGLSADSDLYKTFFLPILNYNKNVKFELISFDGTTFSSDSFSSGDILTKDMQVIHFNIEPNNKWGRYITFKPFSQDYMKQDEKIIYISYGYALSNQGNLYSCSYYDYDRTDYLSWPGIDVSGLISISCVGNYKFMLKDDGTVLMYTTSENYPAIDTWENIVSIDQEFYSNYCCGLTSDGKVLVALKGISNTLTPFSTDDKFIAIACANNTIAALTEKGTVHTYTVPDMDKLTN